MSTLPRLAASPRVATLGGGPVLVSPATLGDYAALLAHLAAATPPGGAVPRFGSPDGVAILTAPEGLGLLVYLALRKHEPGLTLAQAAERALTLTPDEVVALVGAFFPTHLAAPRPEGEESDGGGLESADWCRIVRNVLEARDGWTYADVLALTVDQCNHLMTGRLPEPDAPAGRPMSFEEVVAMHEAAHAQEGAAADV